MAITNPLRLTVISTIKACKQGNIKKPNNLSFGSVAATAVLHSAIHMPRKQSGNWWVQWIMKTVKDGGMYTAQPGVCMEKKKLQEFSSQFNHQFPQLPKLMALTFSKQRYSRNQLMEDESRPIHPRNKTHSKGGIMALGSCIPYLVMDLQQREKTLIIWKLCSRPVLKQTLCYG